MTLPLPSYTGNADELLRADVLKGIADYENQENGCADVSLASGEILLGPDETSDGSWSETWFISACGAVHEYGIVFVPSPQGGTDYFVSPANQ